MKFFKEIANEASLGDYRKKAAMQKAQAGMGAMFAPDPEQRAKELATFKKRERGLERVKARDEAARKAEQERQLADLVTRLPELRAEYDEMRAKYKSLGGSDWQYADREQNLTSSEREARSMEGPMNNLWRQIQAAEKAQKAQGVTESRSAEDLPMYGAIIHRIMVAHTDLLAKYGPEKIMQAAEDEAEWVGDVEEIGTSDVSISVKRVIQALEEQGVAESSPDLDRIRKQYAKRIMANKKAWDALSPQEKEKQLQLAPQLRKSGVAEGWREEAEDMGEWAEYVRTKLMKTPEQQRHSVSQQLSQIEVRNFGSELITGYNFDPKTGKPTGGRPTGMTKIVRDTLKALTKPQGLSAAGYVNLTPGPQEIDKPDDRGGKDWVVDTNLGWLVVPNAGQAPGRVKRLLWKAYNAGPEIYPLALEIWEETGDFTEQDYKDCIIKAAELRNGGGLEGQAYQQYNQQQGVAEGTDNPYGYKVGQTVKLDNGQQGRVIDIFDDSIEVLLVGGRTVTVDFRDAQVIGENSVAEDAEPSDREMQLVKKLGQLGSFIVKNTKLWNKYSEAIDNDNTDWIISLIQDMTGADKKEVFNLSELFGNIGGGLGRIIDFAWAVKEGTWEEDFLNPYKKYRSQGTSESINLQDIELRIEEADMNTGNQGYDNMLAVMKAVDAGQDAKFMLNGEPITLEYPEARFLAGKYKAFLRAGRQEEFLKYIDDPVAFDRLMKQLRDLIDKQKNFKGSVPGERGVEGDVPKMESRVEAVKPLPVVAEGYYYCKLSKTAKLIPEGYKKTEDGYITRV